MVRIDDCINKETGLKEKLEFELSFFMSQLKETVINASGIGWLFEEGFSKVRNVIAVLFLIYIRWWIKLAIFIYGLLFITSWIFPHSGNKF